VPRLSVEKDCAVPRWDIFCRVIDNYGDVGVAWRLARQLAAEQRLRVRLWLDDLAVLQRIWPDADEQAEAQTLCGVEVRRWTAQEWHVAPADVVIEAFACDLPAGYLSRMVTAPHRILWLNLEYLSAEEWVEGCHGLPSLQGGGLQKFFFFPGFTSATGGLLREADLLQRRDALQTQGALREDFLTAHGIRPLPGARLISLFTYENGALADWLDALSFASEAVHLLVPEGRSLGGLQRWAESPLMAGSVLQRGALHLQVLPFLTQEDYDALLCCCDLNLVRGEDSFVRAQWAARPLLWHIYPQQEGAHWQKLQAFLTRYQQGLSPRAIAAQQRLWRAWNAGHDMQSPWQEWLACANELTSHAHNWADRLAEQADLATTLVQFHRNWLSYAASNLRP
jgi:uncharacterized repeat protein (TIGR03837 family)